VGVFAVDVGNVLCLTYDGSCMDVNSSALCFKWMQFIHYKFCLSKGCYCKISTAFCLQPSALNIVALNTGSNKIITLLLPQVVLLRMKERTKALLFLLFQLLALPWMWFLPQKVHVFGAGPHCAGPIRGED
jgi:hypothetical protein